MKTLLRLSVLVLLVVSAVVHSSEIKPLKKAHPLNTESNEVDLVETASHMKTASSSKMTSVSSAEHMADPPTFGVGNTGAFPLPYVPVSAVYDNPITDSDPEQLLPETPTCSIKPSTVEEIRKMRQDAFELAHAVAKETEIMAQRKTYIEQATGYINDRIRELNKVKKELKQEEKWIQVSQHRIQELAEKEKVIKMQDVMSCMNGENKSLTESSAAKADALKKMKAQLDVYLKNIKDIRTKIDSINNNKPVGEVKA